MQGRVSGPRGSEVASHEDDAIEDKLDRIDSRGAQLPADARHGGISWVLHASEGDVRTERFLVPCDTDAA